MIICEYEKRGCLDLKEHEMITRDEFEKLIRDKNVLDLFSVFSKTDIMELFGKEVAETYGYNQCNPHHCYDLWNHTLHTVDSISSNGLNVDDYLTLRIAAFFHDIGKPQSCQEKENGHRSFHGHPQKSAELTIPILKKIGYSNEEINKICLYIGHHDDFINFANELPEELKEDISLREPSDDTVKEVLIKNMFDFKKMGYNEFEIEYIGSFLSTGEERKFKHKNEYIDFDIDILEVLKKMKKEEYKIKDAFSINDYKLLLNLCLADVSSQSDICISNGIDYSKEAKKNTLRRIGEILEHPLDFTF